MFAKLIQKFFNLIEQYEHTLALRLSLPKGKGRVNRRVIPKKRKTVAASKPQSGYVLRIKRWLARKIVGLKRSTRQKRQIFYNFYRLISIMILTVTTRILIVARFFKFIKYSTVSLINFYFFLVDLPYLLSRKRVLFLRTIYVSLLMLLFFIIYFLQYGTGAPSWVISIIPNGLLSLLFKDGYFILLPYTFVWLWLILFFLHICVIMSLEIKYFQTLKVRDFIKDMFVKVQSLFITELLAVQTIFCVLLSHVQNIAMPEQIGRELFVSTSNLHGLFTFGTWNSKLLILLLLILAMVHLFFFFTYRENNARIAVINNVFLIFYLLLPFILQVSNFFIIIFMLEAIILLLLLLFTVQTYQVKIINYTKNLIIFILIQSIATMIYVYGLSIIYANNSTLAFGQTLLDAIYLPEYYHTIHDFILKGGLFIIIGLFIKMGLGLFGIWTLLFSQFLSFQTYILYFGWLKLLYVILLTKILTVIFAPNFMLDFRVGTSPTDLLTDKVGFEYFKHSFLSLNHHSTIVTLDDAVLRELLEAAATLRGYLEPAILVIVLFSLTIGMFGLLYSQSIRRFFAYSSLFNIGFIIVPLFSGNYDGVHNAILFISIYTLSLLVIFICLHVLQPDQNDALSSLNKLGESSYRVKLLMTVILASLAGLPPLLGFFPKLFILQQTYALLGNLGFVIIGITFIGSIGYLRVIKYLFSKDTGYESLHSNFMKAGRNFFATVSLTYLDVFLIIMFMIQISGGILISFIYSSNDVTMFNSFAMTARHFIEATLEIDPAVSILNDLNLTLKEFESLFSSVINDPTLVKEALDLKTQQFIESRRILNGVTPSTVEIQRFQENFYAVLKMREDMFGVNNSGTYLRRIWDFSDKFLTK